MRNVTVFGGLTERYLLEGLQRGVTYNISIVAWSYVTLPSPLVGPITVIPGIFRTAIQWNLSITDTIGENQFVRYREVSLVERFDILMTIITIIVIHTMIHVVIIIHPL